jgi:hypothetical protein
MQFERTPDTRPKIDRKPLGWPVLGVVVGLLFWVIAIPFLGDPRISHGVTPASVEGPPVLVSRSSFSLLAEGQRTGAIKPSASGLLAETNALAELFKPVRQAMKMPAVAEALGIDILDFDAPISLAVGISSDSSAADAPVPESPFGDPDMLPPGGKPVASMTQVVNPTDHPLQGTLRPAVMFGDAGLCRALKMAAVSIEAGAEPVVLLAGDLSKTLNEPATPLILEPKKTYDLALILALPENVPNDFQGTSCTVNFLMEFAEVY